MNWLDIVIVAIVVFSALFGVVRGFAREALALLGWVLAVWVALEFSPGLSELMQSAINVDSLRFMVAFTLLFVITLVLAAVVNHLISNTVRKSALNGTDRGLGLIFGLLRGVVLVAVLTWLATFTTFPNQPAWKDAALAGYFEQLSGWMRGSIPPSLAKKLGYQ
jgi:membrane protein required for colicin V production